MTNSKLIAVSPAGGVPVDKFVEWMENHTRTHGEDLYVKNLPNGHYGLFTKGDICPCLKCKMDEVDLIKEQDPDYEAFGLRGTCPECSSFECPKAGLHIHKCVN